jgi:hypothetical protein
VQEDLVLVVGDFRHLLPVNRRTPHPVFILGLRPKTLLACALFALVVDQALAAVAA